MSTNNIILTHELSKKLAEAAKTSPVLIEKLEAVKASFEKKATALDDFKKNLSI